MFRLRRFFAGIRNRFSERGFSLIETTIALGVASLSVIGAYSLTIAMERHYRESITLTSRYRLTRTALDQIVKDLSETSSKTIRIEYNAISFASARDENGEFQFETYGSLGFGRPLWQKAIVYYVYDNNLYKKEISRTDWSDTYNPYDAMGSDGRLIAENVISLYFDYYPAQSLEQAHTLNISVTFLKGADGQIDGGETAGNYDEITMRTGALIMNRQR